MSWDWVGTVVVGVVGLGGSATTLMAGRQQGETTLQLAREERNQRRLEASYLELQRTIDRFASWAERTMPMIGSGEDPYPLPPENDLIVDASALQLYWSLEVRALVKVWTEARNKLAINSSIARSDAREGHRSPGLWASVPDLKTKLREAEDAIIAQTSAELRGTLTSPKASPFKKKHWWNGKQAPPPSSPA